MIRISLDLEDFEALTRGAVIDKVEDGHEIQIALKDIGYQTMANVIEHHFNYLINKND